MFLSYIRSHSGRFISYIFTKGHRVIYVFHLFPKFGYSSNDLKLARAELVSLSFDFIQEKPV